MTRAASVLLMVAVAGCLAPFPTDDDVAAAALAPSASATASGWRNVTRVLDVPAGDWFGVLDVTFQPEDAVPREWGDAYALWFRFEGFTRDGYVELSAYRVDGAKAVAGGTASGSGGGTGLGIGWTSEGAPLRALYVVAVSSDAPGTVRVGAQEELFGDLPEEEMAWNWTASGEAQVSFYHAVGMGTAWSSSAHGVEVEILGVGPDAPARAGTLTLRTAHKATGVALQHFWAWSWPYGPGAGVMDVAWSDGNRSARESVPFVTNLVGGPVGFLAKGESSGRSEGTFALTGVDGLPIVRLSHVTIPFDAGSLGLDVEPRTALWTGASPMGATECVRHDARASCL